MATGEYVIIGPSGVGKTALVACLNHAVKNRPIRSESLDVQVRALNDYSRNLFSSVISLLSTGTLPFAGTSSIIDYEFMFSVIQPRRGLWGWVQSLIKGANLETHEGFRFMDAPGGAVFPGDQGEVDYAVMGEYRRQLIERLSQAKGIIICADASDINNPEYDENPQSFRMGTRFSTWLDEIFSRAAPEANVGPIPLIPAKRVYICLTKCDRWAKFHQFQSDAQEKIEDNQRLHAADLFTQKFGDI